MWQRKEILSMKEQYMKYSLSTWWRIYYGAYSTYLIILFIWWICFDRKENMYHSLYKIIFPFALLWLINALLKLKFEWFETAFTIVLILEGMFATYEGWNNSEWKYHESWIIFYSTFLIFSISWWFNWKRIIILYLITQIINLILFYFVYKKSSFYFYAGYAFITILLPLVWMLIARIILVFLMLIRNNQELVKIIYKILQIFPEGFLIQELDKNSEQLIVQFVNDTAAKEIVNYENPCGKPIDDSKLNYTVKKVMNSNDQSYSDEDDCTMMLSKLLYSYKNEIKIHKEETIDLIEVWNYSSESSKVEIDTTKQYKVKTIKLNLGDYKAYYIHIFINKTFEKHLTIEKDKHELLQCTLSWVFNELKTPINYFSNSIYLLESNYNSLLKNIKEINNEDLKEKIISERLMDSNEQFFNVWKISTISLLSLIENFIDLSKLESETFTLNEEPFSLKTLIHEIEYIFGFQWTQKGLVFWVDIDQDLLLSSFCSDVGRIKQVLMNVISNAFKLTPTGGISLRVKCKFILDEFSFERNRYLEFKVADTGIGVSQLDMKNLFKIFRSDERHKLDCRGTGVGLTISKKIVEKLGGQITLNSKEGLGTEVIFTIKENGRVNYFEESKLSIEPTESPFWSSEIFTVTGNINQINDPQWETVRVFQTQNCNLSERSKTSDKI